MQGAFVGTFLIGLREGLEAALIVGIVAAFLRRNGKPLVSLVIGVVAATLISIGVGVGLSAASTALPQAQQEMLETVIGVVAVFFVTTMILWMSRNARHLKGELETEAADALRAGGSAALAGMAFLAVLKEGFETAVFLVAAIQSTGSSGPVGLLGAVLGILVAIVIGYGIYTGGVRINLGRFFQITGAFLVFIAGGLVMSTLRTAHEAGWVVIGQQKVADFSGWMPSTSVHGALLTGMFGIQTDPRLIEVLGWFLYVVPVLVIFLWPHSRRPSARVAQRIRITVVVALAVVAAGLFAFVPAQGVELPGSTARVADADGDDVTLAVSGGDDGRTLTVTPEGGSPADVVLESTGTQRVDGVDLQVWQASTSVDPGIDENPVTMERLVELAGGRVPIGLGATRPEGPFDAEWSAKAVYTVLTDGDMLVGAEIVTTRIGVLDGGGLDRTRTVSLGGVGTDVSLDAEERAATISDGALDAAERTLWRIWLPAVLVLIAIGVALSALRARTRAEREEDQEGHEERKTTHHEAINMDESVVR